jgi:hypothetical protein
MGIYKLEKMDEDDFDMVEKNKPQNKRRTNIEEVK